ncbi:MAG: YbaN family protein [Clostridia bacterium]|nr:YbaN family protein [Clostridia bacterium]
MKVKKIVFIVLGCIGLALGAVGAVLPMLPAFPFLLVALICFGKSSERLHKWFVGTKLYKNNLESFVKGQGMTWKTKIKIMITVTLLMTFGFVMMFLKELYIPCGILAGVWLFHIIYFCCVKTLRKKNDATTEEKDTQKPVEENP